MNDALAKAQAAIDREEFSLAESLARPLAETGNAQAQYLLGSLYYTGAEVTKAASREWLERAAAQNHAEACYWLACMGDEWDFKAPESTDSVNLLLHSAELGNAQAQRDVGCYYAVGAGGFPLDPTQGRYWYGLAAEQGHADAQYNFGLMVCLGEGGLKDFAEGMNWIRRAAANGDVAAILHLSQPEGEMLPG